MKRIAIRSRLFACALFSAVMTVMTAPAQATLIAADDGVFGSGAITRDTDSGLEWLDLTRSTNLSYSYVESQFGRGGAFAGWRHATRDEVRMLFADAGIDPVDCPLFASCSLLSSPTNTAIRDLQALVGVTSTTVVYYDPSNPSGFRQTTTTSQGFTSTAASDTSYYTPLLSSVSAPLLPNPRESDTSATLDRTATSPDFGHWLVRSSKAAPVPEPATVALLLSGLIALGVCRRRPVRRPSG